MKQPNPDALIYNRNFKISPAMDTCVKDTAAELSVSASEFMRKSIYFCSKMFQANPDIIKLNRLQLEELGANVGNTIVTHPARLEYKPTPYGTDARSGE